MTSRHAVELIEAEALTPKQFRDALGISSRTLQRWKQRGVVAPAFHTARGHSRYTNRQVEDLRSRSEHTACAAQRAVSTEAVAS